MEDVGDSPKKEKETSVKWLLHGCWAVLAVLCLVVVVFVSITNSRSKDGVISGLQHDVVNRDESIKELTKKASIMDVSITSLELRLKKQAMKGYHPAFVDWVYSHSRKCPKNLAEKMTLFIFEMGTYPKMTLAVVDVESNFDPFAVSEKEAMGLGQIMYTIWGEKLTEVGIIGSKRDLFDWQTNIKAVDFILQDMYTRHKGDWEAVLKNYFGANNKKYIADVYRNLGELALIEDITPSTIEVAEVSVDPLEDNQNEQ